MNKIYTRTVVEDFDGNFNVEVPFEICEYLQLVPNDVVVFELIEDKVIMRKRQEL